MHFLGSVKRFQTRFTLQTTIVFGEVGFQSPFDLSPDDSVAVRCSIPRFPLELLFTDWPVALLQRGLQAEHPGRTIHYIDHRCIRLACILMRELVTLAVHLEHDNMYKEKRL